MVDTRGFEVVAEVDEPVLLRMLQSAWDNGGTNAEGAIPHEVPFPNGAALGPYVATGGQIAIPRDGLSVDAHPATNTIAISVGAQVQVKFDTATTHLASLGLLDMTASITVDAPIGPIPNSAPQLGLIFEGLPSSAVRATLTSPNPVGAITPDIIEEYVHGLYTDDVIPHSLTLPGQSLLGLSFDAYIEFWDDETDPARRIEITFPSANTLRLALPALVRLSNLEGFPGIALLSPMAVVARVTLSVPYAATADKITADLPAAAVGTEGLSAAPGTEGANYTAAKLFYPSLDQLFEQQLIARGQLMLGGMQPMDVPIPTNAQIEALIEQHAHAAIVARRFAAVWTPDPPAGSEVQVRDARGRVLGDAVAVAINAGVGADDSLLGRFVPPGRDFAIGLDGAFVRDAIQQIIDRPEDEGGLGGVPLDFPDIEGYHAKVYELSFELQDGKIHFAGRCTVYDVFCGADMDVSFWADVGLRWSPPAADGSQSLVPYLIDHDADLPWWAWLLVVIGFILGIILGVVSLVVVMVAENLAERIGGAVIEDHVNNQLRVLGAWPQHLRGVGDVQTVFDEPVGIDPSGLVFTGALVTVAQFAQALVSAANAHGPYAARVSLPLQLNAGAPKPTLRLDWATGDGGIASGHLPSHTYGRTGRYVADVAALVQQPGGALTHHAARVRVRNIPPVVDAGADLRVKEGETFQLSGSFTNVEWSDGHEAVWIFGDDTLPEPGVVTQADGPPVTHGIVTGSHAYCTNGEYTVTLRVRDEDGGIGEDTLRVVVENVAPAVTTAGTLFAYPCVPVDLVAEFVDPGWCDRHTAAWRFGDGDFALEPTPATVREVHEPPFGYGFAAVTHTYRALATHEAECVVQDSDGAAGRATLRIAVVDLMNKRFEEGFRESGVGAVANEWSPYVVSQDAKGGDLLPAATRERLRFFEAEELVVRDGRRAQRVNASPGQRVGILQKVGANVGWDYQVTVGYHIEGASSARCRVGIDPTGGDAPSAPQVVWSAGSSAGRWRKLLIRATASARAVTVFLEVEGIDERSRCWFDAVAFDPFPCRLRDPRRPERPPTERFVCVRFADERESRSVEQPLNRDGFVFRRRSSEDPLRVVSFGPPAGEGKLLIDGVGARAVTAALPFEAARVTAMVWIIEGTVDVVALDAAGAEVAVASVFGADVPQSVTLAHAGISTIVMSSKGRVTLIELCAFSINAKRAPCGCDGAGRRP